MSTEYTLSDARPSFAPTPSKLTVPLAVPRAHPYTPWDITAWNSTLTAVGIPQTEWVAFLTGLNTAYARDPEAASTYVQKANSGYLKNRGLAADLVSTAGLMEITGAPTSDSNPDKIMVLNTWMKSGVICPLDIAPLSGGGKLWLKVWKKQGTEIGQTVITGKTVWLVIRDASSA